MTQEEFDAKLQGITGAMCDRYEQFRTAWDLALRDGRGVVVYELESDTLRVVDVDQFYGDD